MICLKNPALSKARDIMEELEEEELIHA